MQREKVIELKARMNKTRETAIRTLQRRGFDLDIVIEIFSCSEVD
jgi:hypothetical protein